MADLIQTFAANASGHDFVVGDIHGCFDQLDALLARIGFEAGRDRLFSVGDLIDRGPDSERAADFIDAPWCHPVCGNHERMMLDAVAEGGSARQLWRMNGGDWFDGLDAGARKRLVERAAGLPYAIEVEVGNGARAGLVHAQMPAMAWPHLRSALQADRIDGELVQTLLWARDSAGEVAARAGGMPARAAVGVDGIDVIFHGHTPLQRPLACANTRWLDTGAFMGGPLALAELAVDGRVWALQPTDRLDEGWQRV